MKFLIWTIGAAGVIIVMVAIIMVLLPMNMILKKEDRKNIKKNLKKEEKSWPHLKRVKEEPIY